MGKLIVKVEHVNPFIRATIDTFTKMVKVDPTPGKLLLRKDSDLIYDISGVIGLAGDARGMISLSFPKETALKIANQFMESDYTELNAEAASAVGELANIIAGAAKNQFQGLRINISLPSVIQGVNHRITENAGAFAFVIPFTTVMGRFDLLVSLKSGE